MQNDCFILYFFFVTLQKNLTHRETMPLGIAMACMCHLMPQRHLPEWREEDEWAFVHSAIWISNKDLDNTMPATVNCIYKKSL